MDTIITYYYQIGLVGQLFFLAYLAFFSWAAIKLPISVVEKVSWIILFAILPGLGAFIFYTFRNSKFLMRHTRRKFDPKFNRSNS
jgi:hypothetical protein